MCWQFQSTGYCAISGILRNLTLCRGWELNATSANLNLPSPVDFQCIRSRSAGEGRPRLARPHEVLVVPGSVVLKEYAMRRVRFLLAGAIALALGIVLTCSDAQAFWRHRCCCGYSSCGCSSCGSSCGCTSCGCTSCSSCGCSSCGYSGGCSSCTTLAPTGGCSSCGYASEMPASPGGADRSGKSSAGPRSASPDLVPLARSMCRLPR